MFFSGWKWVLVLNHSIDNEFDLHENTQLVSIWVVQCTRTRFETKANSNSEMGYSNQGKFNLFSPPSPSLKKAKTLWFIK